MKLVNITTEDFRLAEELRHLDKTLHMLGQVGERKGLSENGRRAVLIAIKALNFSCRPEQILSFNAYLLDWPGELSAAEEGRLLELGLKRGTVTDKPHPPKKRRKTRN